MSTASAEKSLLSVCEDETALTLRAPLDTPAPAPVKAGGRQRGGQPVRSTVATFLYARLQNFAPICRHLSGDDLTAFVNEARRALSEPVVKLGGEIAQRRPDSILAVFSNTAEARKLDHAQRGLHAAILVVYESVELARRVAAQIGDPQAPALTVAAGVNLGNADISGHGARSSGMVHATGEAVEIARLLEVTAGDLGWSIASSGRTMRAAAGRAEGGRIGSVAPPDDSFVDIVEVTGLVPRRGSRTKPEMYQLLRRALAENAQARERPCDVSLPGVPAAAPAHLLIEGYRILRQIGAGGMASVFLAQAKEDGPPQVLKIMPLDSFAGEDGLQRFIQEYALLAQVNDPHVARIHRQDFSAGHAYIAMEYFPGGDLRARIAKGVSREEAIGFIRQTAQGLAAIHAQGIVHRDLKPDNLMLRQDGTLALADFGVAKQVSMLIMNTGHGDIVGTPSYLSPEQARGERVDARCDLYSLGVLAYELLTGRRPYHAETAQAMLDLHINALVPQLPPAHKAFQPVLNRLMAKDREQRYPSAKALLDDLDQRGL